MKHLQHHQQIPIIIHIVSCHELDKLPCDGTNSIHIGIYIGILLNNSALIIQVSIVFCFFFHGHYEQYTASILKGGRDRLNELNKDFCIKIIVVCVVPTI